MFYVLVGCFLFMMVLTFLTRGLHKEVYLFQTNQVYLLCFNDVGDIGDRG
jgi:hypothetical protein